MHPLTFDKTTYYVNGRPAFLYSGEFHYFRVPRADWRRRMALFREAGGNCLATYIPWLIHEPEEGRFAFDEGQLDLEGFLRVAAEEGLYVIARPGPYQYSELIFNGLPRWLCQGYPSLLAKTPAGANIHPGSISYLHPLFLEKTRAWFAEVCPRIARWTVSRGGPVAFTQIDNELVGIHTWFGGLDHNPETMGFGDPRGRYPRFLQAKYGDIARVNARYGTDAADFAAVTPLPPPGTGSREDLRRLKDYFDFQMAVVAEYGVTLAGLLRQHGIDTPIVHNAANPEMNAWFTELCAAMGPDFLLGSDHYYTLNQTWAQNNPTPQYAVRVFVSLEMLRLLGYPPTVYEMPGGSASDWPPITPVDAKACYLANVAYGTRGINFYIFTGGPNVPGTGGTSDIYDYGAAIGADGEVRPLYYVQQEVGRMLQRRRWLAAAERVADCRVALDLSASRARAYWDGGDVPFSPPAAATFLHTGVLSTAFCASLSPALVRLDADDWTADTSLPLIVPCSSVMRADHQQRLVRFLQAGGRALFTPVLPALDEDLLPCTILADFLGASAFHAAADAGRLNIAGVDNVYSNGGVFLADGLPAGAQVLGVEAGQGRPVAWQCATPGGGAAVVLTVHWLQAMREHERMLVNLLAPLGLSQRVHCDNPNLWTSLWTDGRRAALFLLNLLTAPQRATVTVQLGETPRPPHHYDVAGMSVKVVEWTVG